MKPKPKPRKAFVVDTNVIAVANGRHEGASGACVSACRARLAGIKQSFIVSIDSLGEILDEYGRHASHKGQPGMGDMFFKWLHNNQANDKHCERVCITPHDSRGYEEFPGDASLINFDRSDRKFVAVALTSKLKPQILNATDSDWGEHAAALRNNKITVIELCRS